MKKNNKFFAAILLILILSMVTACSAAPSATESPAATTAPPAATPPPPSAPAPPAEASAALEGASWYFRQATDTPRAAASDQAQAPEAEADASLAPPDTLAANRMIIRSSDMGISTYDFEDTITGIQNIVNNRGGFIETSHQWMDSSPHDRDDLLWRASFVLRVPVGLFDQANRELVALAQILHFNTSSQDVTMEFHDLASRLQIREEEKRRVEAMLDAATELSDIVNLEAQLTGLRLAVDAYQRRMTEIDQLSSFSTISVTVYEVRYLDDEDDYEQYYIVYDNGGFGGRVSEAFASSLEFSANMLTAIAVFVATIGLPVALIAGLGFVVYKVLKRVGVWNSVVSKFK